MGAAYEQWRREPSIVVVPNKAFHHEPLQNALRSLERHTVVCEVCHTQAVLHGEQTRHETTRAFCAPAVITSLVVVTYRLSWHVSGFL